MPRAAAPCAILVIILVLGGLAWIAPPASAHRDIVLATGLHEVAAQDELAFSTELHYHRLVGHARVVGEGPVEVRIARIDAPGEDLLAGHGRDLRFNTLIRCCVDEGWSDYVIIVANRGSAAVEVDLRLVLMHDGAVVLVDDAETGAAFSIVAMFGIPAAFFAAALRKPAPVDPRRARNATTWAAGLYAAMWIVTGALAAWGMLRFGGGPVGASIAATADLPSTGGQILTTYSWIQGLGILAGVVSIGLWTKAARASIERKGIAYLGIAMGLGFLAACLIWAIEYGSVLVPGLVAVASAVIPLGGGIALLRRSRGREDAPVTQPA